jgi:chromosome segregation ATPase
MADDDVSAADNGSEDDEAAGMLADAVDDGSDDEGSQEDDFDADKAKQKINKANREAANLRKRIKDLEPLAQRAKELEDSQKTELERLTEQLQAAQSASAEATAAQLRIDVALEKAPDGMSKAQIRKLSKRLTGSNREELEEDANELFADFMPAKGEPDEGPQRVPLPNSHRIKLDDEQDPRELAKNIRRV